MNKILLEVTHVSSEKHEAVQMDERTHEAMKHFGLITQTVTLKPVNRHKVSDTSEVEIEPIRITLPGKELNVDDRFMLELTPVR